MDPVPLSQSAALRAENRRGIAAMAGAMAVFVANDALVKYVSQSLPPAQLIFMRGLMATLLVLAAAQAWGAMPRWREAMGGWVLLRAAVDAVATMLFLVSLFHLPLAIASAINLAAPLFMVVFAVLFLRERPRPGRWLATAAGFLGVLLIIQPSAAGINGYALTCLAATLFHATRDLLTRRIASTVPSILITLATSVAVTLLAGLLSVLQPWQPFSAAQLGLLALAAALLASGYHLLITSMRHGEISLVAPFRYTGLVFALVLGFAVWGEVPNWLGWAGIALLLASGLYLLTSERIRGRVRT